jgi:hypothetical protein
MEKKIIAKEIEMKHAFLKAAYYRAQDASRSYCSSSKMLAEKTAREELNAFVAANADIQYNCKIDRIEKLEEKIKDAVVMADAEREMLTAEYNKKIEEIKATL